MKYYNIKRGRADIIGKVIQVDPEAELENRVKDFIENLEFEVEIIDDNGHVYYEEKHSTGSMAIGIIIDEEENIGIYINRLRDKEIHLKEISKQEAERLREYIHKCRQFQKWDNETAS